MSEVTELHNDIDRAMAASDVIAEEDALRLENVSLERDLLKMQASDIQRRIGEVTARGNALGAALRAKYQIVDGDSVEMDKRLITRKR